MQRMVSPGYNRRKISRGPVNMTVFEERGVCSDPNCNEPAVGKAWDGIGKPNRYCRKHLEMAKKLGYPIKTFSETDVTYDEDFP